MRARSRVAAGAAAALLALLLASPSWGELRRRFVTLVRFAPRELAVRRLGGSGTAFDRRYFSFLENARRRIPRETQGVIVLGPSDDEHRYLAAYVLAPEPVGFEAPRSLPPGWAVAAYGGGVAPGLPVIARLPEGVLYGEIPGTR